MRRHLSIIDCIVIIAEFRNFVKLYIPKILIKHISVIIFATEYKSILHLLQIYKQ